VPYLDALPTVGSIAGQVLLGRKLVENWAVWLAVNVVSVGCSRYKGCGSRWLLYALFAVLSVVGWRAWARLEPPMAEAAA
jgi:nicotinamide mononucleotide transporter